MALIQCAVEPQAGTGNDLTDQSFAQRRSTIVGFDRFGSPIIRQGWKTVEQVVAELKAQYPDGPPRAQGSSIDMIREDRDSR
jgi:hypothetical protein